MPSARFARSPRMRESRDTDRAWTLPSQNTNWQTPECQLPKFSMLGPMSPSLSLGPSARGLYCPADRPTFSRASPFQMEASPMYFSLAAPGNSRLTPCRLMGTCFSPIRSVLLRPSLMDEIFVIDVQVVMVSLFEVCVPLARTMAPVPLVVSSLGSMFLVGLSPNEQA